MQYDEFERRAQEEWERIPEQYRAGVDGLVVKRSALPHPSLPDIYTLGECVTESYPSDFGGPDTIRSVVVLHYGSFLRLSRLDPGFDWDGELWETLTHELQHHLESLAADDALVDMDYAADENYKRYQGREFDPFFYRRGIPEGEWLRAEDEFFLEMQATPGDTVTFAWDEATYEVTIPDHADGDVAFLTVVAGVHEPPGALHLVVRRPPGGWRQRLGGLLRPQPPRVVEGEVHVRRRSP
ncbi:MAG TPA: hypothetical protein VK929_12520 [Longimicrobiales bacterium]|nr:hypothetical protein [Longimicrobiales bacterium]